MNYLSVTEFAALHGISDRTVRNYCVSGKISGAVLAGKSWIIPDDAVLPEKGKHKTRVSPLLQRLRDEQTSRINGGIYHRTQIDFTYNSNHIEGSRLTHDQTRFIFETNTIGSSDEAVRVDDIVETVNHFRAVDMIIASAHERLTESYIKELHRILKSGTQDSLKSWFSVGDYKRLPNEVGGVETSAPENVQNEMAALIREYNAKQNKDLDDLLNFHTRFEKIHPFQDGNGRVGRLVLFKECLANNIVPFIITEDLKMFYYRGLREWQNTPGYLRDTCLTAQDNYIALLNYFRIKH